MVFSLAGCGGNELTGTWKLDSEAFAASFEGEGADEEALALFASTDITFVFGADGTVEVSMTVNGATVSAGGTYTADGSTITITAEDGTTTTNPYRFDGDTLYITSDGAEQPFVRG